MRAVTFDPRTLPASGEVLMPIVIEIDEEAEIRNSTQRNRTGKEGVEVGEFFGLGDSGILPSGVEGLSANLDAGSNSSLRMWFQASLHPPIDPGMAKT